MKRRRGRMKKDYLEEKKRQNEARLIEEKR